MKKLLLLLIAAVSFTRCGNGDIVIASLPPTLTLYVTDAQGRPFSGAIVDLYDSGRAYEDAKYPVLTTRTDSRGFAKFHDLKPIIYWFDIYDTQDPYDNFEGINFTKYPVEWDRDTRIDVILYPYNPQQSKSSNNTLRLNRRSL